MAKYSYLIKDSKSQPQKGVVEATTINMAVNLLHEKGYYVITLKEIIPPPTISINIMGTGISYSDLVHVTRQLATMITAGLTLVEALGILRKQLSKPQLIKLISEIEDQVKAEGKSFAAVLEKYPRIFPPIYLALVRAGEASGKLDIILSRLADNLEKSRDFKNKVRGAMVYPTIVVSGMVIVSVIVMTVVVPRMSSMYKEFGVELPLPTRILIAISDFFVHSWYVMLGIIIAGTVSYIKFRKTDMGSHLLATIQLKIPILGNLVKQSTLTDIARTLSLLIDSGVPILSSLEIVKDATTNVLFREAFIQSAKKVEKGFPLSEPLSDSTIMPPILGQMVAIGEQTGKLGESLMKLSHYFEAEAESVVRTLTTMIEPLIMVVLGLGVGFLVLAVLLPIYSLTSKF